MYKPNVAVCVRMRAPLKCEMGAEVNSEREAGREVGGLHIKVNADEKNVYIQGARGRRGRKLQFDEVFGPEASQDTVYRRCAADIAAELLKGVNCCWLSMGPSRSGKSFTTFGELGEYARMGIVPRLASDLLGKIECGGAGLGNIFLTVSYFQVSGSNKLRDLLTLPPSSRALNTIRQNIQKEPSSNIVMNQVSQCRVARLSDLLLLLERARRSERPEAGHAVGMLALHRPARALKSLKQRSGPESAVLLSVLTFLELSEHDEDSRLSSQELLATVRCLFGVGGRI